MVTKLISLAGAITTIDLGVRSRLDPGAPVYYFASSQLWVNLLLIVMASLSVVVSFNSKNRFKNWYSYAACTALASFLIILGGLGVFYSNFRLDGWDLLLPLDYLMLLECGVVIVISSLSYRHPKRPAVITTAVSRLVSVPKQPAVATARGMKVAYQAVKDTTLVTPTSTQRRVGG